MKTRACILSILVSSCATFVARGQQIQQTSDGFVYRNAKQTLRVAMCSPKVAHVVAGPGSPERGSPLEPWINGSCSTSQINLQTNAQEAVLTTGSLRISLDLANGNLSFKDSANQVLLNEGVYGAPARDYEQREISGATVYRVTDRFWPQPEEAFYGLGQHQSGSVNYRGAVVNLGQANTDTALPLLISNRGYGLLWNTASHSHFDNRFATKLKLSADAADAIDYFILYGPELDEVIHEYRMLTGSVPLFPKWAYGFFQSKDHYKSINELLAVASEYRKRHIPLDAIVQDWQWWTHQGDPDYAASYAASTAQVASALAELHRENVHAMISIWAVTDKHSGLHDQLDRRRLLIPGTPDYDPASAAASEFYWNWLPAKLLEQGWDAFWLDASEPEEAGGNSDAVLDHLQLSMGVGARYTNIFPLLHTGEVYSHWRRTRQDKRAFLLSRSAFLGQQRNAASSWSGDIFATFSSLTRQIAAGLNFSISGIPYWTTDIGGYAEPDRDTRDPAYQELYTRWFEYGVFCPVFRTHGWRSNETNEIYSYGAAEPTLVLYDKLRYRLLPYVYSLAWRVTHDDDTIMRPLVMDWRTDPNVVDIGDQFMFGPALLVNPVAQAGATKRIVYLPDAHAWYDFWTGQRMAGKQSVVAEAPLDRIPLYVRAGSILPMAPEIEYTSQDTGENIELRVYPGTDGAFTLYADAGEGYRYEQGEYTAIPMRWDDKSRTLTLGAQQGHSADGASARRFRIVLVSQGKGIGEGVTARPNQEIIYQGQELRKVLN